MKHKITAIFIILIMIVSLIACGSGQETTLSGMVVSVNDTIVSIIEMNSIDSENYTNENRPQMPGGMDGFQDFGNFNPEEFFGELPEDGSFPQWGNGQMPEDFTIPEDFTFPEGGNMPDFGGNMPNFGGNGDADFGNKNFMSETETTDVDISDAHISVEIDGGKATGSIDDIKTGTFVTITTNARGKAITVLVSSQNVFSFF